ncbi:hypothetical protein [Pseudomonas piscis]|uniref:hypothetical protein n=1 Tax=Pseudomonas piscis TaxID=2614538 RepID=UPI0021D58B4F|nr:hypothetical protein [Pseudomonas piscis]MCU7647078.1 hypothetical protein [Pseudomonas piscis]
MAHPDHLVNYVNAIQGAASARTAQLESSSQDSWSEQDCTVTAEQQTFAFDDGALIKRLVEQDDYPSDLACAECWITYEVVRQPGDKTISPAHVSFNNACREAYWQRYFSA